MRTVWARSASLGGCAKSIGTMAPSTYVTVALCRASAGTKPDAEKRGSTISVAPLSSAWKNAFSALV